MGLPVTNLTSTRAGPAAGGTGRFGGVAAMVVRPHCGGQRSRAAAGAASLGVLLFFLGSALLIIFYLGLSEERSPGRGGLRAAGYWSRTQRHYVR